MQETDHGGGHLECNSSVSRSDKNNSKKACNLFDITQAGRKKNLITNVLPPSIEIVEPVAKDFARESFWVPSIGRRHALFYHLARSSYLATKKGNASRFLGGET